MMRRTAIKSFMASFGDDLASFGGDLASFGGLVMI